MSNTNERITQISALVLNYEKIKNTNPRVADYEVDNLLEASKALSIIIKREAEIKLEEINRADEDKKNQRRAESLSEQPHP